MLLKPYQSLIGEGRAGEECGENEGEDKTLENPVDSKNYDVIT